MSLRVRLLAIIGLSLVALWSVVAAWMFVDLRSELRAALDDRLAASARMVAGLVAQMPAANAAGLGQSNATLDVIAHDGLACEVSLMRGEVKVQTMARTAGSPPLDEATPGYSTRLYGGKLWRSYVLQRSGVRIATADRMDLRNGLLRDIALSAGIPFAVALMGSLPLLWFGIGRGLLPIERVRAALERRRPDDSDPLPQTDAPPELRPLVGTIHHLLERVQETMARERRFTDDAAHELRTPLTAIKTHLQVARLASTRSEAAQVVTQALASADLGVLRLQRTLDQLLVLARLDSRLETAGTEPSEMTYSTDSARQAIEDTLERPGALPRVVLEANSVPIALALPQTSLVLALRNLLDNALRYAPPSSMVVLRVQRVDLDHVSFSVLDAGPGLSEAECGLAVQRFWRRGSGATGSGLGLSIVKAIATRYGGELILRNRPTGGLEATLIVLAISSAASAVEPIRCSRAADSVESSVSGSPQ